MPFRFVKTCELQPAIVQFNYNGHICDLELDSKFIIIRIRGDNSVSVFTGVYANAPNLIIDAVRGGIARFQIHDGVLDVGLNCRDEKYPGTIVTNIIRLQEKTKIIFE